MEQTKSVLNDVMVVEIEPNEIIYLVSEMNKLREGGGDPNWFSQIGILADRYPKGSSKPIAITMRMEALGPMMKDRRAKGWTFDGVEPGCQITHEAMFYGAAFAPLHESKDGKRLQFEPEEFFTIVLRETHTERPVA